MRRRVLLARKRRRDLRALSGQFLAASVVAMLGVALFAATNDSYLNLRLSYDETAARYRFADYVIRGGPYGGQLAQMADRVPGVRAAAVRPAGDVGIGVQGDRVTGRLIGVPAGIQPPVDRVKVLEGDYIGRGAGMVPAGEVLVERHFAEARRLDVGDGLEVFASGRSERLTVAGIVASPEFIWPAPSLEQVFLPPGEFGALFADGRTAAALIGQSNELLLYTGGKPNRAALEEVLKVAGPYGVASVVAKADQPSNRVLQEDLRGFRTLAVFFPVLFLIVAALALYVLLARLVESQRPIVGYLRAEGIGRFRLLRHYLGYGFAVTVIGGIVGIGLGALLGWLITGLYISQLAIPAQVVEAHPVTWVIGLALVVVTGLLAAAAPALAAGKIEPAVAMRDAPPGFRGHFSLMERILPPLRRLPRSARLVLRNAERNPKRSLATLLATVLALVLVMTSLGLIVSTMRFIDVQFTDVQRENADAILAEPLALPEAEAVGRDAGARAVVPVVTAQVEVKRGRRWAQAGLWAVPHGNGLRPLPGGGPRPGHVFLGRGLAGKLGVSKGSEVQVTGQPGQAKMTVGGLVDDPLTAVAYVDLEAGQRFLPPPQRAGATAEKRANELLLTAGPTGTARLVENLSGGSGVSAVIDADELERSIEKYMVLIYAFAGVMVVFGGVLAFALMYATIAANLRERAREFATLRAMGMSSRRMGALVFAENLYLVMLTVVPGAFAGTGFAALAVRQYSNDQTNFPLRMGAWSYVIAIAAVLAATAISLAAALRTQRRTSLAAMVRERGG